jgi:hypothetical protein
VNGATGKNVTLPVDDALGSIPTVDQTETTVWQLAATADPLEVAALTN